MSRNKQKDVVAEFTVSGTTLQQGGNCLHCHSKSGGIQVSCDECAAYICNDCHWCHEFQANHEIRVCDRCDGFYCRACDEMDQCDDCGEVVCGGCSSLLSCKFCGGGLCPDCATACGKCGIVLCARDSKFAVECDTCKLSYCLVCLASSHKDPCVRCGHRPSKRMEQLVHLRLKSIYKAFQQSNPKGNKSRDTASTRAVAAAAAAACGASAKHESAKTEKKEKSNEKTFSARQAEADLAAAALLAELEEEEEVQKKKSSKKKKKKAQKKKLQEVVVVSEEKSVQEPQVKEQPEMIMEEETTKVDESMEEEEQQTLPLEEKMDPDEVRLYEMVADSDGDGIEALLAEMRGVPGKAAIRKNAKKALKRLREEDERKEEEEALEAAAAASTKESSSSYKPPEPLLTLVSRNVHSNSKSECVLHMSPQVVGWVIGKGGQRIRDLMEDSGSKVWIDQDSMGTSDARIVYVSGPGKAVDDAVRRIKDLVAKAPVGGTTTCATVVSHSTKSIKMPPPSPDVKPMDVPSKPSPSRARSKSISNDKDWAVHEITCEARFVPLLIGRRGWTIKHIQDSSGARVDIDQSVTPRKIKISGKKDCVATAIRMVKDVLSYPHAQLERSGTAAAAAAAAAATSEPVSPAVKVAPVIPAMVAPTTADELASLEAERIQSNHSPPPSSLIMTGGDKSTISASSSLSSTPEPSMASTSKSGSYKHPGPLSLGDVIPPNYAGPAPPYLQASLQADMPREPPLGMSSGAAIGAVGGLSQPQQQDSRFLNNQGGPSFGQGPLPGGIPFGHAPPPGQGLQRASSLPMGNVGGYGPSQQLGGGALYGQQQPRQQQHTLGGQSLLRDALMGSTQQQQPQSVLSQAPIGQAPMQQQGRPMPSFPADSYQPVHLLFQNSDQMPGDNVNDAVPDLFGRNRCTGISASEHNNMDHSAPYLFQGQGPPHRQNSDSQIPPHLYNQQPHLPPRRNSTGNPSMMPHQQGVGPGGLADSDIVDSLFGPVGGVGGGGDESLLSGIQGLNLNSAGGAPGWTSSIAGWGSENNNAAQGAAPQSNSGLSGGGMLNGSQQQQQQQHPGQQSRFDWG